VWLLLLLPLSLLLLLLLPLAVGAGAISAAQHAGMNLVVAAAQCCPHMLPLLLLQPG
jgi:hypothetical protein